MSIFTLIPAPVTTFDTKHIDHFTLGKTVRSMRWLRVGVSHRFSLIDLLSVSFASRPIASSESESESLPVLL